MTDLSCPEAGDVEQRLAMAAATGTALFFRAAAEVRAVRVLGCAGRPCWVVLGNAGLCKAVRVLGYAGLCGAVLT